MPRSGVRGFSPASLRQARAASGLRVDELAHLIGASRQAIGTWERGQARPTPAMLLALSKALRVSTADLAPIREADLRIGDLRTQAGLTQVAVAEHLRIAPSAVGDVERGLRELSEEQVATLASLYGLAPDRVRRVWKQTHDAVVTRLNIRQ